MTFLGDNYDNLKVYYYNMVGT